MKTISFKDFETHFDDFIDDVIENGRHYCIQLESGKAVMLIPYAEYECLFDTYKEWLDSKESKEL